MFLKNKIYVLFAGFLFGALFFFSITSAANAFNLVAYEVLSPRLFLYSYKEYLHPYTDTEYGVFAGLSYKLGANAYLKRNFGIYGNISGNAELGKIHYNGFMALNNNTMVYYYHTDGMLGESDNLGVFEEISGFTLKEGLNTGLTYWIRTDGLYDDRLIGSVGYRLGIAYNYNSYSAGFNFRQSFVPRSSFNFVKNRGMTFDMGTGNENAFSVYIKRKEFSVKLFYNIVTLNRSDYSFINGVPWYEPSSIAREGGISLGYSF